MRKYVLKKSLKIPHTRRLISFEETEGKCKKRIADTVKFDSNNFYLSHRFQLQCREGIRIYSAATARWIAGLAEGGQKS